MRQRRRPFVLGPLTRLTAAIIAGALLAAACSSSTSEPEGSLGSETTSSTSTPPTTADTTPAAPVSEPDDLRELWSQLWVASGLVPEEREAAVAEIADQLDPSVAAIIPELLPVPEEREVLSDPAFTINFDGSIDIRDCVLYTPPYLGFFAPHIHEGRAVPDGEGGWIIEEAGQVGQGCVPAAMADKVLADYAEFIQAFRDSGNPPDPNHPNLAKTMTGTYLEDIISSTQELLDENWYYEDFDINHPEIVEIAGSNVVTIRDCTELDLASGIFDAAGARALDAEPSEPGEKALFEVSMRLEGGQWKTEGVELESQSDCQIAPTPMALPRI